MVVALPKQSNDGGESDGPPPHGTFPVPEHHLKLSILDLTKVEFWACQEAENDF